MPNALALDTIWAEKKESDSNNGSCLQLADGGIARAKTLKLGRHEGSRGPE